MIASQLKAIEPIIIGIGSESLPSWFCELNGNNNIIGISDPGLDRTVAREQAIVRASILASTMQQISVSGVSDTYTKDGSLKYEELIKFKSIQTIKNIVIVDSFTTRFNELIVLARAELNNNDTILDKKDTVSIEHFKSITKLSFGWNALEKASIYGSFDTTKLQYEFNQNNSNYSIHSSINGTKIDIPLGMFDYKTSCFESYVDSTSSSATYAHKGLWFGFFEAFINSLSESASNLKSNYKTMEQKSNNNNNLIRNTFSNNFSVRIKKISTEESKFKVELIIK